MVFRRLGGLPGSGQRRMKTCLGLLELRMRASQLSLDLVRPGVSDGALKPKGIQFGHQLR